MLPDGYDATLSNDLVQLAAQFGAAVQTDHLSANVVLANKVEQETWQDHHLVLLGRPAKNALLRQFNDSLPWPFVQGGDALARTSSGDPGLELQLGDDATVGLIQIIQSPWNNDARRAGRDRHHGCRRPPCRANPVGPRPAPARKPGRHRGLSQTSDNPRIQSTDTRPAQPETPDTPGGSDPGETPAIPTMSDSDKILLAEYWWK